MGIRRRLSVWNRVYRRKNQCGFTFGKPAGTDLFGRYRWAWNICCKCGCRKCRKQWTVSWGCPGGGDRDGKAEAGKKYLKEFFAVSEDAHCYQENDILAGLRYLNELARRREMPLVICMAIGTSFGGHNGDSLLAGVLDGYALLRNRCVVTGTGNEAAQRHHYYGTFTEAQNTRTAEIR